MAESDTERSIGNERENVGIIGPNSADESVAPRRRGRPPGSRNRSTEIGTDSPNGSARITVDSQPVKRGRPKKVSTLSNDEAQAQASVSILMLDTIAVSLAGPDAAISQMERFLIEPPLARMAQRNPAVSLAMQRYADPFTLLVGLLMYLARVAAGIRDKRNATTATGGGEDVAAPRVDDVAPQMSFDINDLMRVG